MASPLRALGEFVGLSTRTVDPVPAAGSTVAPPSRTECGVSVDRALTLPSVFRAFGILSTVVAQVPLITLRGDDTIPSPPLIRQPDESRSLASFLRRTVTALAATGNAYWLIRKDSAGKVISGRRGCGRPWRGRGAREPHLSRSWRASARHRRPAGP